MKVRIESPMWERNYEMTAEAAAKLMQIAYQLENGAETPKVQNEPILPATVTADREETATLPPIQNHGGRAERMFGSRDTWQKNDRESTSTEYPEGWKGFLILRCHECGDVKDFFAKERITSSRCKCGCEIELDDLIPAYANCGKCGKAIKYRTNIRDDYPVTVHCLDCGAPIDMQVNARGTAMVPMSKLYMPRGGGASVPEQRKTVRFF